MGLPHTTKIPPLRKTFVLWSLFLWVSSTIWLLLYLCDFVQDDVKPSGTISTIVTIMSFSYILWPDKLLRALGTVTTKIKKLGLFLWTHVTINCYQFHGVPQGWKPHLKIPSSFESLPLWCHPKVSHFSKHCSTCDKLNGTIWNCPTSMKSPPHLTSFYWGKTKL